MYQHLLSRRRFLPFNQADKNGGQEKKHNGI
jgi:hypothetical protein